MVGKWHTGSPDWQWIAAGTVSYIALGFLTQYLPNPMVPEAILALNIVVPVIVGFFTGPINGAMVGLFGTGGNFGAQFFLTGPDWYEAAAILPHTIMGAAAGYAARRGNRMGAALTVIIGHLLNLLSFAVWGLLPLALMFRADFWTGLTAEITVDLILIALATAVIHKIRRREWETAIDRLGRRYFILVSLGLFFLILALALYFWQGVTFAAYLMIVPVAIAAFFLGGLEALLLALLVSGLLGLRVIQIGLDGSSDLISLILIYNLVALALGELAVKAQKQQRLAQRRMRQLEEAYQLLAQSDQFKSEMIQNISHELRTPLAVIIGYSDMIAREELGKVSPAQRQAIEAVWEHGRRLTYLVEQITVLHQAEMGVFSWQALALDSLVRATAQNFVGQAQTAGCEIALDIPDELPVLEADLYCMGRAVAAYLDNAVKFSPKGGLINVKIWDDADRVCLTVQDGGIGVPLEEQEIIFRRFYQVDGSSTRHFGGMGTGLALVREVVQGHGGDVWVNSQPGQGAEFGFWLPRQRPPQPADQPSQLTALTQLNLA
jgi:signal transduction histidine kinase